MMIASIVFSAALFAAPAPAFDPADCAWDFTTFTNVTARTLDLEDDVRALSPRLDGTTLRLMARLGGCVQIGGYGATGELRVALDGLATDRAHLRVARHANRDYGKHMPIRLRRADGSETELAVLTLSDVYADFMVKLPPIRAGDTLVLASTTDHLAAASPRCAVNLATLALRRNPGLTFVVR